MGLQRVRHDLVLNNNKYHLYEKSRIDKFIITENRSVFLRDRELGVLGLTANASDRDLRGMIEMVCN